jgi:integrase/recombinase XerD
VLAHRRQLHNDNDNNVLLDRKIDDITVGLHSYHNRYLKTQVSSDNALIICNYIISMKTEINLSDNYRRTNIRLLTQLTRFHNQKPFSFITREDILAFLDNLRKPENSDPLHKWIGSYNVYTVQLTRFFKWFYSPTIDAGKRMKPPVVENIPPLRRKEKSIYKPSALWTNEEDLLFLRYCSSSRMRCYHAVVRDTGCRPHEILKLKIKDISFKSVGGRQYAEITVNGKTGTRSLPLIDSIPYLKEYLDHSHPQPGNPNAIFISGEGKSLGRSITPDYLYHLYIKYKEIIFPKMLDNPNVSPEDKPKIRDLLRKPWNPYVVGRHASLTQKSRILKEATLRVFAGWTPNSDMPRRYVHLFGNAACEDVLEAYGLVDHNQNVFSLQSKQCPQCSEPNKLDSKFCAKCRMVLTYDAYSETVEEKQQKESEVKELKGKYEQDMKIMREEMNQQFTQIMSMIQKNPQLAQIKPESLAKKELLL